MKKFLSLFGLLALMTLLTGLLSAAASAPNTTFTLVQGLPSTMKMGDVRVVTVRVESDQLYASVQAMPDLYFPGRGVVALQGGARSSGGSSTTLSVAFKAKGSTASFPGGVGHP